MTQEQIEKAAKDYASDTFGKGGRFGEEDMYMLARINAGKKAFRAGANWRINSVWHTVNEVPSRNLTGNRYGELCLVITRDGNIDFAQACYEDVNGVYYFKTDSGLIELHIVKQWAYIDDLIPTEE